MRCNLCKKLFEKSYDNIRAGKSNGCQVCTNANKKYNKEELRISKLGFAARDRCVNEDNKSFDKYGARGIKFKFDSVEAYVSYVKTLPGYFTGAEIDRIDNEGNYEVGNLRWASRQVQVRNTRRNIVVEYNNETMVFADFVEQYTDLSFQFARTLHKRGWTLEQLAAHHPAIKGRRTREYVRSRELRPEGSVCNQSTNNA